MTPFASPPSIAIATSPKEKSHETEAFYCLFSAEEFQGSPGQQNDYWRLEIFGVSATLKISKTGMTNIRTRRNAYAIKSKRF
jgi:hypothetical protein